MLWLTSVVAMSITATRIHRYLADFVSETTDVWSEHPPRPSTWTHVHIDGHGLTFSVEPCGGGGGDTHSA